MSIKFSRSIIIAAFLLGACACLPSIRAVFAVDVSTTRSRPAQRNSSSTEPLSSYLEKSRIQSDKEDKHRLREGTKITNRLGRFQQSGDRATFVAEGNLEFGGLPNLNLERVVRMLKSVDEPESIWWSVSGIVTEFSGRNYLLIERAVYKSASPHPSSDKVEP
jgi:hypothetical protein